MGLSPLMSFENKRMCAYAVKIIDSLELMVRANRLGAAITIVTHPTSATHSALGEDEFWPNSSMHPCNRAANFGRMAPRASGRVQIVDENRFHPRGLTATAPNLDSAGVFCRPKRYGLSHDMVSTPVRTDLIEKSLRSAFTTGREEANDGGNAW